MVFVADDLGAWLVALLADAGRKKLTALVLGSDQERALAQVATAAVQGTADEVSPSDSERAVQIAMVISEIFRERLPAMPLAGAGTLLEGLQAGIERQLVVLDDAGLTGTGQSSADVLGVSGADLADRLTVRLVRQIMFRGSGGGPLTPLADQLNHDLTHLQGQRVEGMLAQLLDELREALARPGSEAAAAGRPLGETTDPFALEVHRPVQPTDLQGDLPVLPVYVPRQHDGELGRVVTAAAEGNSGIAALVGGSSTGKTRACWEALGVLRDQKPEWRLWHPIAPSRPDALLAGLAGVGPRTVVWLNEAQYYLDTPASEAGECVAAGLRELLRDPARGPVLVLATMWPSFWDVLTTRPPAGDDPHAQARELLAGCDITVPAAFTPAQLVQLGQASDVRLVQAAREAQDGQVIQFLSGAPELLARYRNAPPAAMALIHAAMDGRRLGMRPALPHAFLEEAAPGYLTDWEWDQLTDNWMEQALAYTAALCKGVRGPLTRIRPRLAPIDRPSSGRTGADYLLADYLDQQSRATRRDQVPPAAFWAAAARYADPGDMGALGNVARARGLFRDAAQLYKYAAVHGDTRAAARLVAGMHSLHPADQRPAQWAVAHADLDNPAAVTFLLGALRWAGAEEQATMLASRAAAQVPLGDPAAVASLLGELRWVSVGEQAALLARNPAAQTALDNPAGVASLLEALREAGAGEQVTALADRAAAHAPLDNPAAVATLLVALREAGAGEQVTALADRAAAHAPLDSPAKLASLLHALRWAGAREQATVLGERAVAAYVSLGNRAAVASLRRASRPKDAYIAQAEAVMSQWEEETRLGAVFREQEGHRQQVGFGREADGSPYGQWGWEDLN